MDELMARLQQALSHHQAGRFELAEAGYRAVLDAAPGWPEVENLLGVLHYQTARPVEAERRIRAAIAGRPGQPDFHNNLANALKAQDRIEDAIREYEAALTFRPDYAEVKFNLANTLQRAGRYPDAIQLYRGALAAQPTMVGGWGNLGAALTAIGEPGGAVAALRQAVLLDPAEAGALNNLGNAAQAAGDVVAALAAYRRAVAAAPGMTLVHRNMLLALNLAEDVAPVAMLEAARDFSRRHLPAREARPARVRRPGRLRIGYVPARMFRRHTLANVMLPLVENHDRERVEVTIYSDLAESEEDAVSRRFRSASDQWRRTAGLDDAALAAQITEDGIDVVIDAVGHAEGSRLGALARGPAPRQIATPLMMPSGVAAITHIFADPDLVPPALEAGFDERVLHLPRAYRYDPIDPAPEPAPPPVRTSGHITFGSMNTLSKLSPRLIDAWARLLQRVPRAQLLIKARALADPPVAARLAAAFAARGIDDGRLVLRPWSSDQRGHLATYDEIDIALDSFPYNGVTTTCEALWMGVPVITLAGDRVMGRYGVSLLRAIGFEDGIGETIDGYVARAAALAEAPARLASLRGDLRGRMAASALCDGRGGARAVEAAIAELVGR